MAQGRSFWDWYAHVNDDLRHHLIERGWYGQQTRDDIFQRDVAAMRGHEDAGERLERQETQTYTIGYSRSESDKIVESGHRAEPDHDLGDYYQQRIRDR